MNFITRLFKNDKSISAQSTNVQIDRREIPADTINRMQQIEASKSYRKKIYRMYYNDYPEKPFISQDREFNTNWIEQAQMFPAQSIIPIETMTRFSDGLLPGHIYMLYWLNKYGKRRIPAYFEYEYGICFAKEKRFLVESGYLGNDNKPTNLGNQAMREHCGVIEKKHPKPLHTGDDPIGLINTDDTGRAITSDVTPGSFDIPSSDMDIVKKEFEIINELVFKAMKLAHLNIRLKIDFSLLRFASNCTYYEYASLTKTGRVPKCPLTLHYAYADHIQPTHTQDYFGEINYLRNGRIGSARLIFWNRDNGYMIIIGTVKDVLAIKKVEKSSKRGWDVLYKLET